MLTLINVTRTLSSGDALVGDRGVIVINVQIEVERVTINVTILCRSICRLFFAVVFYWKSIHD
jgi:hypothetical protein